MTQQTPRSRLSAFEAAWVIARRDFVAVLFSRAFLFFLLGPLFPVIVGGLAGSIGMATTTLMLPMQLAASMGRAVSPVAGVLIATAQIAGLNSIDIVKRNLIPMVTTLILLFFLHFI